MFLRAWSPEVRAVTEDEFVNGCFELAPTMGLTVEERRPGKSICFNPKSNKWLNEMHLRRLHPDVLQPDLGRTKINQMIEAVAPGRPCTHKGFRELLGKVRAAHEAT